jgi:transglutaminase-like putative cysteine protease
MPLFSVKDTVQRIAREEGLGKTLGLDRAIAESYTISGLPRQHLVGLDPKLSQATVFVVKTGELPSTDTPLITIPIPRHYWRWLTYDYYDGHSWATSPAENEEYPANETLFDFKEIRVRVLHQQVEKANPQDNRLYWSGTLVRANQPIQTMWRVSPDSLHSGVDPILAIDMLGSLTTQQAYSVDSLVPLISEEMLRASSITYPTDIRERYLQLPDTITDRTRQLAEELTANLDNPYDKAKAIEAYLRTFPYSLDVPPPPPNQDIADHFLFDLRTGYCDYYATSMIVLARASGLPSRLVIGYSSGGYDPVTASYIVREANAHSWVEVYFSGIGWVEFEPTAGQALPTLLEGAPPEIPAETNLPITQRLSTGFIKKGVFPSHNYSSLAIGFAATTLLFSIWLLRTQGLLRMHPTVSSIYRYVYYHGKRIVKSKTLNLTPSVFAERLKEKLSAMHPHVRPGMGELDILTSLYQRETYSAHPISRGEHRQALAVWRKLFWRLIFARIKSRV